MQCTRTWINREGQELPCGYCPDCRQKRVATWSMRLIKEDRYANSSHFITLTYDTIHVPLSANGHLNLSKRDCQLFFKRLRKAQAPGSEPIRYYLCGEYGGQTNRPHYHIILFNADPETVSPAWGLGSVHFGKAENASVSYTLKYISKPGRIPLYKGDDRQPEFSLYSKQLGNSYLTDAAIKWHRAAPIERSAIVLEGGVLAPLPKSWKSRIFPNDQRDPHSELRLEIKAHYTAVAAANKARLIEGVQSDKSDVREVAQQELAFLDNRVYVTTERAKFLTKRGKI